MRLLVIAAVVACVFFFVGRAIFREDFGARSLVDLRTRSGVDHHLCCRYFDRMSSQKLTAEAMALPLSERVSLAQALWESIDAALPDLQEDAALAEAIRRDQELSSGLVAGRTHEQVMQAACRSIGCA